MMYERIAEHPTAREIWARALVERGVVEADRGDALVRQRMDELQALLQSLKPEETIVEPLPEVAPPGTARQAITAVPMDRLREISAALLTLPEDFTPHRKLDRAREKRRRTFDKPDERTIEWAVAEELALATILADGVAIRMTGEDVERGTFSQRHAVLHDATPDGSSCRCRRCRRRRPPSRSTTRRSPRTRSWGSSTATASRRATGW
jgi:2-oxoglutarate dehydrogenase E1 component